MAKHSPLGLNYTKENMDIIITVEGGVIQDVQGIPPGVRVIVRDYDIEGMDDVGEEEYVESVYEAD